MGKLFGTDGIRGDANRFPITPEIAVNLGRAVAVLFGRFSKDSKIVIGRDTRISGQMLEYALGAGICSAGTDVHLIGVLPTPGIAFMTRFMKARAGIVVTASHNPYSDNGIKIFDSNGYKLFDPKEAEVEKLMLTKELAINCVGLRNIGRIFKNKDSEDSYAGFLKNVVSEPCLFKGIKIVTDCANGAVCKIAPRLFSDLGADVIPVFVDPNGKNINANCGSEHNEALKTKVLENGADVGLGFDGDGDRLIAVDEKANVLNGDHLLLILAGFMKKQGTLQNNRVVSTIMSNMGFRVALKTMGIEHEISDVGDRYVMEKMIATKAMLGGEDSGHVILPEHHTTGDGMLTAIKLIMAMISESKPLSELGSLMTMFPRCLEAVEVRCRPDLHTIPELEEAIKRIELNLGKQGRALVRYSGTQPFCRVMTECSDIDKAKEYCGELVDLINDKIGS